MLITPFFPSLRPSLAPAGRRTSKASRSVLSLTLCRLEERFAAVLPNSLFVRDRQRRRLYTIGRTFWSFLFQIFHPGTSCREVVRQVQALYKLHDLGRVSSSDGAYCQARLRLPQAIVDRALKATGQAVEKAAPLADPKFLQGRSIKVVDASAVTLPDSPTNRKDYPKVQIKDGTGFPMLRVLVLFCLASGAIVARLTGSLRLGELRLFEQLITQLDKNDIVLGDRAYGHYIVIHLLERLGLGVGLIARSGRKADGRKRKTRLGRNDWLLDWRRGCVRSALFSAEQWKAVPLQRTVRIVRGSLWRPGFRVRQVTLVTTLLDPKLYPAQQILEAYLRRWNLELCFDDLKTTLQMEMLSCQSPAMVRKELDMHLIAYNLIRLVTAQAAREHHVAIANISFKGTLDGLRHFCHAISHVRRKHQQLQLWEELLRTLVEDALPYRPNRREPRAVKKQKNKYDRLNCPRHRFCDPPKSHKSTTPRRQSLN